MQTQKKVTKLENTLQLVCKFHYCAGFKSDCESGLMVYLEEEINLMVYLEEEIKPGTRKKIHQFSINTLKYPICSFNKEILKFFFRQIEISVQH